MHIYEYVQVGSTPQLRTGDLCKKKGYEVRFGHRAKLLGLCEMPLGITQAARPGPWTLETREAGPPEADTAVVGGAPIIRDLPDIAVAFAESSAGKSARMRVSLGE